MASSAVPTKRVSTTLRANPVLSAGIGLAATAGRGSEFNKLAEELNSHPAERLRSCRASSDSTRPDLSGKATNRELASSPAQNEASTTRIVDAAETLVLGQ